RKLSRVVTCIAPSMSITLPQSVDSQTSIFWNGDCTSSSLRVTRKPIDEPVGSNCSCSQSLAVMGRSWGGGGRASRRGAQGDAAAGAPWGAIVAAGCRPGRAGSDYDAHWRGEAAWRQTGSGDVDGGWKRRRAGRRGDGKAGGQGS